MAEQEPHSPKPERSLKKSALDLSVHSVNGLLENQNLDPEIVDETFLDTVEFVGAESIIVNGIPILVDNETDIVGRDNQPIELAELAVGDLVDIKAVLNAGGIFLAKLIRVRTPEPCPSRVKPQSSTELPCSCVWIVPTASRTRR